MKHLFYLFLCSFFILTPKLQAQNLQWQETHNGIWKAEVGQPEAISLLKAAAIDPKSDALAKMSNVNFPLQKEDINAEIIDGKTYLRLPLKREEKIYGLGLHFKTYNQRGRILNLHVDHYGGKDNGRTHAPVPFYVSSDGYGVLVDVARYITVYAGTAIRTDAKDAPELLDRNTDKNWQAQPYSDVIEILVPAEGLNIYVFGGDTPLKAVQRYNLFCGGGYLPPKWGLGFTQRVPTLYSQEDILKEVKEFEKHDFPLDFIGVEPGWHSMAYPCTFEWDKNRFPDPKGFIESLAEKGVRANLWLNPYVSPEASLYPKIKPFSGTHTVWNGIVPDFNLPETRQLFKEHFLKEHLDIGVSGYKIDEVDGYDNWVWPDVAKFPSGLSGEQMRQIYGLQIQKLTADWFKEKNQRTYGLVRASNAGASNLPYVIYNDYYSHKDFITALVNSSFIGVLWTPEVRASGSSEEWVRRMQSVCFSPMAMLNAWADGTKPWTFPDVEKEVKEVADLRMSLLPYLYTAFAKYQFEGTPPFRAMQLVDGFNLEQEAPHQYMVGEYLLVAPMFARMKSREVILPEGKWYDFYTGAFVGENETITVSHGIDKIPLFVKDGGIIPMIAPQRQAPKPGDKLKLKVRHYGSKAASYSLYDDDGLTFDYEKGLRAWQQIEIKKDSKGKWKGSITPPDKGFGYEKVSWRFMTK